MLNCTESSAEETAKFHDANLSPIQQRILPTLTAISWKFLHKNKEQLNKKQLISYYMPV